MAGGVTTTSTYDAQDRITSRWSVTYTHSADGERLTSTSGSAVTAYGWSGGRLASVSLPGGPVVSYKYDAFGRRVARLVDGVLVRGYLWDGGRLVAETDSAGAVLSRFVYASRGHVPDYLVAAGVTYRLVSDERGSVRLVVNTATGAVVQRLAYDAWGRVLSDTNPAFQPFGFAGGLTDPSTGLVRFGARDYDPTTTRWLSRDTIGFAGGFNHYAYADGDPVNRIDPTGHSAMGCFADILGVLGMIPVVGAVFDIGSALAYAATGDWGAAGLALAGIILPIPASKLKGLARHGDKSLRLADEAVGSIDEADDVTRVGRWMSPEEFDSMSNLGRVVEGGGGRTYVINPPNPAAYSGTPAGSVYAEFDVPTSSLRPASKPEWSVIPGPNVTTGSYGPAPSGMPTATCITLVCTK